MKDLTLGDVYRSNATEFLSRHGIPDGIDFVITNLDADKVSLHIKHAYGKACPWKLTVAKAVFGQNFTQDPYALINPAYATARHFFPEVNAQHMLIFPSPLYSGKR